MTNGPLPPLDVSAGLTALATNMQAKPQLVISFYHFGIIMRQNLPDGGEKEYPVSPEQLAGALAAKVSFDTGLLSGNTLCIKSEGVKKVVAEFRPAQRTALHLQGSEQPVRIPLPGLVLIRTTIANDNPQYRVYAVKKRPEMPDTPLFVAPLPNTDARSICWGSVQKVNGAALQSNSLAEDWRALLGSIFTNHNLSGKSLKHNDDVRQMYLALEAKKARTYPMRDLVKTTLTLGKILEEVAR